MLAGRVVSTTAQTPPLEVWDEQSLTLLARYFLIDFRPVYSDSNKTFNAALRTFHRCASAGAAEAAVSWSRTCEEDGCMWKAQNF